MIFKKLKKFEKEFKKLSKKYHSLHWDFNDLIFWLEDDPTWKDLPKNHIVRISWLWEKVHSKVYKVRKFYCQSLKSNWDIRIIYRYSEESDEIEFCEIEFIEIFHKNTKDNHDIERIKKYL